MSVSAIFDKSFSRFFCVPVIPVVCSISILDLLNGFFTEFRLGGGGYTPNLKFGAGWAIEIK